MIVATQLNSNISVCAVMWMLHNEPERLRNAQEPSLGTPKGHQQNAESPLGGFKVFETKELLYMNA